MKLRNLLLKIRYVLYLFFWVKIAKRPYHAHIQLTRRCNFRCRSCRVWKDACHPEGELSLGELEVMAKNLKKIGLKSVSLTGGEPLLRKDILEIVKIFKQRGFVTRLQTNGYLLEEPLLRKLLDAGVDDIFVSLDTLDIEPFLLINGLQNKSYYDKVLNNVKAAARLCRAYGSGLLLTAVLQPANVGEVDRLLAFASGNNVLIGFYGLEMGQSTDENNIRAFDPELAVNDSQRQQLKDVFVKIRGLMAKPGSPVLNSVKTIEDYIRYYSAPNASMKWNCNAGTYYIDVLPDGKICACNATPAIPGYTYQNIGELYHGGGREEIFRPLRKNCSGCICTRQLEHLIDDKWDMVKRAFQFSGFLKKR